MSYVALITGASSGIGEATARLLPRREPDADIILVARRQDRLDALAAELNATEADGRTHFHAYAADLTDVEACAGLATYVRETFGHLNLLVNNAGARWSGTFAEAGYENVAQTMAINFDAQVRLTEALLPLITVAASRGGNSATGPEPAIVNVASTAARVARPGTAAYSASKFALAGWTDALHAELRPAGIHVGLVCPGFISTEGFPATEFVSHPLKKHMVGTADQAAEAILKAGPGGKAEVYVPGFYWLFAAARILTPGLLRAVTGGGAFTTKSGQDAS